MCLILFAFHYHPDFPLIVAANRDEYYKRPTKNAHFWEDYPNIFAGKDLEAGGTWMGITKSGRFAAVTNVRNSPKPNEITNDKTLTSRGKLTTQYLKQSVDTQNYLTTIKHNKDHYAGFNLIVGNHKHLSYYSNQDTKIQSIRSGIYGLSNGVLDEPWPKVSQGKQSLRDTLKRTTDPEYLLHILLDSTQAEDADLPHTGISVEMERVLSSRFICTQEYGTRSSTLLMIDKKNLVTVWEKSFSFDKKSECINKTYFTIDSGI